MITDQQQKPPYRVPLMTEIAALPWNGLTVASTFSGCGGSCLGYRMAGYKVLWANEFIPAAQDTYRFNHPDTYLNTQDIRVVTPDQALAEMGLAAGELDLFDGSPPCASFSTAGKREAGWGKVKSYSDTTQRIDDLFNEYIRLLRGIQPKVFIAENVGGLVKGTAKGYFLEILAAMKASGYRVTCRVLDAQWLGVPQMRQRTIFVGVREDLKMEPVHPKPLPYRYSVRDVLPWIAGVEHGDGFNADQNGHFLSSGSKPSPPILAGRAVRVQPLPASRKPGAYGVKEVDPERPCATVTTASPGNDLAVPYENGRRKFTIAELKRICAFPDDFVITGSYSQQWERLGRAVPPMMMYHIARTVEGGLREYS